MKVLLFLSSVLLAVHFGRSDPIGLCPSDNGASDILLADTDDCAIFYQCDWGEYVTKYCASHLNFNTLTAECDYPENVNCERSGGSSGVVDGNSTSSEIEVEVGGVIGSCPAENYNEDVLLPDSLNCGVFYKCFWGEPVLQLCPDDLVFSVSSNVCDWPENVDCDRSNIEDNNGGENNGNEGGLIDEGAGAVGSCPEDNPEVDVLLPDAENCAIFYKCDWGVPVVQACPDDLLFNVETDECDWAENVDCDRSNSGSSSGGVEENNNGGDGGLVEGAGPIGSCPAENGDEDVLLPDEENCAIFYKCNWGEAVAIACPDDLVFNVNSNQCDWAENVDCDRSNVGGGNGGDGGDGGDDEIIGAGPVGSCPEENGDVDVLLPDAENCGIFYKCDWGVPVAMACPDDLVFNVNSNECDWPENVDCDRSNVEDSGSVGDDEDDDVLVGGGPVGSCPEENGDDLVLLPDVENCAVFYKCNWGEPVIMGCPDDLLFNANTNECDWAENVDCNGGSDSGEVSVEESSEENVDDSAEVIATGPLIDCPEVDGLYPTYIPDKTDCNKYYVCEYGNPIMMACADGLYYDGTIWACNYPELVTCGVYKPIEGDSSEVEVPGTDDATGPVVDCPAEDGQYATYIPDKTDCTKYYVCEFGNPILMSCPPGLYYDGIHWTCNYPEYVQCGVYRPIEGDGSEGTVGGGTGGEGSENPWIGECPEQSDVDVYLLSSEDPHKFYVCVGDTPVELTCPADLVFDIELQLCDYA